VFVVFRRGPATADPVATVSRDGQQVLPAVVRKPAVVVRKAIYGMLGSRRAVRDVSTRLQALVDRGTLSVRVSQMAVGDDPAPGMIKTLVVDYTADGQPLQAIGKDPETVRFGQTLVPERSVEVRLGTDGRILLDAWREGRYELKTVQGKSLAVEVRGLPAAELGGPWEVTFADGSATPRRLTLDKLVSWSEHPDPAVKYFSGTAVYRKAFSLAADVLVPERHVELDLGRVAVMAEVKLNGRDLGILWKPPFRVDVTDAIHAGGNVLELSVVNLWINRMIGDEELPEDSPRTPSGTLTQWPPWLLAGQPSPTGRQSFTSWRLWKKGDPLVPSGLLGPVRLETFRTVKIAP
jgi:hypothetical protein